MSSVVVSTVQEIKPIKSKKEYDLSEWVLNPQTNRHVKIGSKTHKQMIDGVSKPTKEMVKKDETNSVINPVTNKRVLIGGKAYKKMMGEELVVKPGFIKNPQGNRWIKINGKTYKKLEAQGVVLETQAELVVAEVESDKKLSL